MSNQISSDCFKKELFDLLKETFEQVEGIYLDRGTSLFETLETISAQEASRPIWTAGASIAAQIEHMRFYLRVLEGCIKRQPEEKIDWQESWQLQEVTADEWETLKQQLRETYQSVLAVMDGLDTWEGEDDIGASLGILAHTACHLGAIRQALHLVR